MAMNNSLSLTFALSALSATVLALHLPPAVAQTLPSLPIQFNPDTLENPGRPGDRRRGGGSRGSCQADIPLTAIAYASSQVVEELGVQSLEQSVGAFTTQAQPTLWFYLPGPLTEGTAAEFIVKDGQDTLLYQGQLVGQTDSSGVISVPMPLDLEPDADYHWFLILDCDEGDRTRVDGWIERRTTGSTLSRALDQANDRSQAALYANSGYLQDALTELAALRIAYPEDEAIAQDWATFLSALDLPDLTAAPLLDCCQVTSIQVPTQRPEVETEP